MKRCTGDHHLVGCFLSRLILRLRTNHSEGVRDREDGDQAPTFLDVQAGTSEGVAVVPRFGRFQCMLSMSAASHLSFVSVEQAVLAFVGRW